MINLDQTCSVSGELRIFQTRNFLSNNMDTESVFNIVYEFKNNKVINEGWSWTLENRHIIENKILYRENGTR